jgi:ABC-type lipoprotein release transport system permease subunit
MAAVWLWVRSERRRHGPALLIAAIVALAAGAGMAALAGARRADSALERLGEATGQPNISLNTGDGPVNAARVDQSVALIDEAAAIPGVEAVTHQVYWAITPEPEAKCLFGVGIARTTGTNPFAVTVAGQASGTADSVTINQTAADMFGIRVGSELRLRTTSARHTSDWMRSSCAPVDGPQIPVRVTAIAKDVEDVTDAPEPFFAVGRGFYEQYAGEVAGCACAIGVRADPDRLDSVRSALEALYGPYGFTSEPVEAFDERAAQTIGLEVDALRIAAVVLSIAGMLVVIQVIARQAAALAADHRTRSALGMTRRQIAWGTALVIVPAIVAGALLAVIGALLASSFLPRGLARRAEPAPGFRIDAAVLAGGFVAVVVIASAAAWVVGWMLAAPARHAATRPVRGALGPLPPHIALGVRMATNPAGDRGRAAAWSGVLGAALAVAGLLAVATLGASADHLRHTPALFGVSADLAMNTEADDPSAAARSALDAALADPDIEAVASRLELSVESSAARGPSGATVSVEPEGIRHERGLIAPTIQSGRLAAGSDEVVLGRATAAALGAELGDRVTVTRVDDGAVDYVVVGLAVSYGTDVVDQGFHVTDRGLERLTVPCRTTSGADSHPDDEETCADAEVHDVVARTTPAADPEAVAERLGVAEMIPIPTPSIVDRFREIGPVPWYLAAMLGILGAGGLMHASSMASRRRGRELAIARALGFTPRQAAAAVRWQGLTTAVAGLVLGLAAGVLIGRMIWRNLATTIGVVVDVRLPWWAPIVAVAGVIVVVLAVTAFPSARVRRARPAELLRTE